jgi:hypothetical protein
MYASALRASLVLLFVSTCLSANSQAQAQAPEPQISGRVVRADNGLPIEGATIELEQSGAFQHNAQLPLALTDSRGEFRFVQPVKDGTYFIQVSAEGFVSETYSRDGTLEGKFQRVDASTHLREIDFRLKREAVIRGVVTELDQKPVAGISVTAVHRVKSEDGSERLLPDGGGKTDANGQFVLTKLPADTYFICVNGPTGFNASPDDGGWYRETWFGNANSADKATAVTLSEGQERNDIRIAVQREQRYRVTVLSSGPEGQTKPDRYQVHIDGRSHSASGEKDGSWVIPGIPPGHYRMVSIAWSGDMQYLGEGETQFDVADQDVTVHVQVGGLGEIHGVVKPDEKTASLPAGMMLGITSSEAAQGADVDAAGRFSFGRVLPGEYQFKFVKNPTDLVIRNVRCRGADVTKDSPLRVGDTEKITDCEVTVGAKLP